MPRAKKGDKFFLHSKAKSGHRKGKYLLGSRSDKATLQELLDFLKKHNIQPSQVEIMPNFITYAS
jgi:hypothetical protein